jgi:hypothetical protein
VPAPFATTAEIAAPRSDVWSVLTDIARWPEWTDSVEWVDLHGPALALGVSAVVRQPRLPVATWTVTALDPGRSFTWVTRAGGVRTTGFHVLGDLPDGRTLFRTGVEQRGLPAPVVRLLLGGLTRRYLQMEADGLRRRCES